MDVGRAAFVALYGPLILLAALGAWLITANVLWPAWRRRELSLRHHGLAVCIVLLLAADSVEHVYYGIGRFWPDVFQSIHSNWPALTAIRLLIMSGSMVALAAYGAIAGWRINLPRIVMAVLIMWAAGFTFLMLR